MTGSQTSYSRHPIGSLTALARTLNVSPEGLRRLVETADFQYRLAKKIKKKDGRIRCVYEALEPLKSVQARIKDRILRHVEFPDYLMGGIPDPNKTRGYVRNASRHAGAAVLIGEDIENFFPSVRMSAVRDAFQHVMHFPSDVADTLARLCTRQNALVQGASTSTYVANLLLHRNEPALVEKLAARGLLYTRFIDDVHASAKGRIPPELVTDAVREVRSLMEREGLRPKRQKQFVARRGESMQVHNLNIGARASIPLKERHAIRAQVHHLERRIAANGRMDDDRKILERLMGQAARIKTIHPREGSLLKARLKAVRAKMPVFQGAR